MTSITTSPTQAVPGTNESSPPVIVVGVDGSEHSSVALRWAAQEAKLRGARLRVVQAWHLPPMPYPAYLPSGYDGEAETAAALDKQLLSVVPTSSGIPTQRLVSDGPAAEALIAASKGADLLVVGSRGLGGFSGLLLGSVSAQVVHHAHCPVVVVRG